MASHANQRRLAKPLFLLMLGGFGALAPAMAQETAPMGHNQTQPPPLVQENKTIQVSEHVYAIPDGRVNLVPNIGIIVGSRATLVVDAGMGPRNGETVLREIAKVSKNSQIYFTTTHFHPEHMTGVQAFPAGAIVIRPKVQQEEVDQKQPEVHSQLQPKDPGTEGPPAGRETAPAGHPFRSRGGPRPRRNHGETALAWPGAHAGRQLRVCRAGRCAVHGRRGDQSVLSDFPR